MENKSTHNKVCEGVAKMNVDRKEDPTHNKVCEGMQKKKMSKFPGPESKHSLRERASSISDSEKSIRISKRS